MASGKIGSNLAQEIVNAVKEVVDKDINFIDKNGLIIGSTDKNRLHVFHQAGYTAIRTLKNIIVEDNDEYEGSKKGINYPIKINNNAVGAIGITGEPNEISKLGFLVTKITEVFIKEQQLNYNHELDKQRISHVLKSIIYNDIEDRHEIENILEDFNISSNQKFAVVVMKINKSHKSGEVEKIENDIKRLFDTIGNKFKVYIYPNEFIALINEERYKKLKDIYLDILGKYEGSLFGGIGTLKNLYDTHKSYQEAKIALEYSTSNSKILTYIDDLKLELILESLEPELKNQYVEKILTDLDDDDVKVLQIYYSNDMSLKKTSEDLYIHKNTLQYKLEKISQKSGLNPRSFNDSVILYLAIKIKISI